MHQERSRDNPAASAGPEGDSARSRPDSKATARARRASEARRASGRRRHIDPTTSEREYTSAEMEFMKAMQDYKQRSGRMFPTWSEVLEVLRSLGYEKSEMFGPSGGRDPGEDPRSGR